MDQIKLVFMLITFSQTAKGLAWSSISISIDSCRSSSIVMVWDYTLAAGESVSQTDWTKSNGAGGFINVADDFGGTFNPATGYSGRLARIGSAGLQINNAQSSDSGVYYVVVTLAVGASTATATVSVHLSPDSSCMPSCDNSDSNPKCEIPQACPVKTSVQAVWTVEGVKDVNEFTCNFLNSGKTYSACTEGAPVTSCYSGVPLCIQRKCRAATTTTSTQTTSPSSDMLPIIIGVSVGAIVLILLTTIIICCCCQCCYLYRYRKKEKEKLYGLKLEQINHSQGAIIHTTVEDGNQTPEH